MLLKIDSREPDTVKKKAPLLESSAFGGVEFCELETADFAVPELGIGIERKEASDFASSVQDRRISEQGDRMVEEFEHRYVILEGDGLYDLKYTSIGDNSLIGQQVSLAAKRDIRLINTPDINGTLYAVKRIIERVADGESVGHAKTFDVETDRTDVAMLAQVDGVSVEKAEKILKQTPIEAIAYNASDYEAGGRESLRDELTCIDGVGQKTAEKVINAFT